MKAQFTSPSRALGAKKLPGGLCQYGLEGCRGSPGWPRIDLSIIVPKCEAALPPAGDIWTRRISLQNLLVPSKACALQCTVLNCINPMIKILWVLASPKAQITMPTSSGL